MGLRNEVVKKGVFATGLKLTELLPKGLPSRNLFISSLRVSVTTEGMKTTTKDETAPASLDLDKMQTQTLIVYITKLTVNKPIVINKNRPIR
jgi:hypothetical protein